MGILVRFPHAFLRRHLSMAERVLIAAGLALLIYGLTVHLPAYPSPWEVVVAVSVFFVTLWSPPAAYFLVVIAALYPLYTLSLYLAVLFLAIALLGQRVFMNNLGAVLLVLIAPWLAQFHLEWIVVLLGGLWWGKTGGAWIGGAAALWGQALFGMTGQYPNWLDMMGIAPSTTGLVAQFKDANSLETLKLIITPLAPNPTLLLYHLLQVVLWAMVGGLTGGLAETGWAQQKHPWRAVAIAIFGAGGLALGSLGLAKWLEQYKPADFDWIIPGLLESALYAAVGTAGLEILRDFAEHPLPAWRRAQPAQPPLPAAQAQASPARFSLIKRAAERITRLRKPAVTASASSQPGQAQSSAAIVPPENLPRRDAKKQPPDDIIKIELD